VNPYGLIFGTGVSAAGSDLAPDPLVEVIRSRILKQVVPGIRVEPTQPCGPRILSPARLRVPPLRLNHSPELLSWSNFGAAQGRPGTRKRNRSNDLD
jgi:hypothetical protein